VKAGAGGTVYLEAKTIRDCRAEALCEAVHKYEVKELNLRDNQLGDAGAEAIAAMLRTNRSLTSLNLRHNKSIGDAGEKAVRSVREAVKGREGFGLYLSFDFGARGARSLVFDEWLVISKGNFILFETGRR